MLALMMNGKQPNKDGIVFADIHEQKDDIVTMKYDMLPCCVIPVMRQHKNDQQGDVES